jgi:hypothetical protein
MLARWAIVAVCGLPTSLTAQVAEPTPTPPPTPARAEPAATPEPAALPDLAPSVERLLKAAYLSEDEQKDLRIFHGAWRESDLDTPARAARAALIRGDYLDPAFDADGVDPVDRAEAALMAGNSTIALQILEKAGAAGDSIRADMLRARAAENVGRNDDAVMVIDNALQRGKLNTPEDIVCGVRMLAQRIRLRGTDDKAAAVEAAGGAGQLKADAQAFHQMIETLGRVRQQVEGGRLYWPALLAEAELLYARDNAPKAQDALGELVSLNPACAQAWFLLGKMSVDAFNFEATEAIALRLDALAGNPAPVVGEGDNPDPAPPVPSASPEAAIIRARAAIRQVDGAHGAEVIDALLTRYPTHPQLLAVRAAAEATRFEFEALKQRLADYDKLFPNSPTALYEAGRALAESRQYAESAAMLAEAHKRLPAAPEILSDLGLMCVQWGKDDLALDYLEKAYALDPFNLRTDNTLRLVRELATYARVESPHFIVRYKPGVDEVFARDILGPMEENHALVSGNGPGGVDHQPFDGKGKTVIDLMPDHAWFGVRIAGMPAIHTIAASTGPVIAMEAPREGAGHNGNYDWKRVLRHEYTHTVNLDRTHNRIPHWFTEAGAVYMELSPRDYQTCQLLRDVFDAAALFDFTEINVAFVRPKKPSDRAQGYAQGHWMYEYIITRWGNKAPLELMDLYAQGVREEQAFNTVLGVSRVQFMEDFKLWAREQLVSWGMLPPAGVPTVKELLDKHATDAAAAAKNTGTADPAGDKLQDTGHNGPDASKPNSNPAPEKQSVVVEPGGPEGEAKTPPVVVDVVPADAPEPESTPELVQTWLEQYPAHPDLLELALEDALSNSGGKATPELVPLINRYAAARPVDPKPHRLLAQMYLASADPAERASAIEHLEYLDAREQKLTAYATQLAKLYFARNQEGDLALARAKAERATQLAPYEAPPRELAATIAISQKDYAAAERHIIALTKLEPDRAIHQQRLEALRNMKANKTN